MMWMVEDDSDYKAKVDTISDWARHNVWFNPHFIESMRLRLKDGRDLTDRMKEAIDKVYSKTVVKEHFFHNRQKFYREKNPNC